MEPLKHNQTAPATALDGKTNSNKIVNSEPYHKLPANQIGGRSSNRPPLIVKPPNFPPCKILASGVDTMALSIKLGWRDKNLFEYFSALKEKAQLENKPVEGILKPNNGVPPWKFEMLQHGLRAYTWLLSGKDYFLKVFNSIQPTSRPSVTVEIRSETLWANGPVHSIEYIIDVLEGLGADILEVKTSRIDLCVDVLMDAKLWTPQLKDFTSTTAKLKHTFDYGFNFSGIVIGKGQISARLYDKVREICQISKKYWMFDIYNFDIGVLTQNQRIIRIEYQLKREVIKKLIDCDVFIIIEYLDRIWAYCTQSWLKFQDNPGEHHSKRHTFDWWIEIQNGFQGIQTPTPLVRTISRKKDKKQLCAQIFGLTTSLQAIVNEEKHAPENNPCDFYTLVSTFIDTVTEAKEDYLVIPAIITKDVQKKRVRYHDIK